MSGFHHDNNEPNILYAYIFNKRGETLLPNKKFG